jgi:hypothetical protein
MAKESEYMLFIAVQNACGSPEIQHQYIRLPFDEHRADGSIAALAATPALLRSWGHLLLGS